MCIDFIEIAQPLRLETFYFPATKPSLLLILGHWRFTFVGAAKWTD